MAYSRRDGVSSGPSYLDGIPVKIGEKFRPLRKITLPLSFQHHYPVELLNEEYDFSLENNVLEMVEMKKRSREALEKAKAEKLAKTIEEFTRTGIEDSDGTTLKESNDTENFSKENRLEDYAKSEKHNLESASTKVNQDAPVSSSFFTGLEPHSILKPVPTTASVLDKPDVTKTCKLNLEDFEAESSPFDCMELKTLNDMEELKSVLQNANANDPNKSINHLDYQAASSHQNGLSYLSASVPTAFDMSTSLPVSMPAVLNNDSVHYSHIFPSQSRTHPNSSYLNYREEAVSYLPLKSSPNDDSNSQVLRNSHSTPDLLKEIRTSISAEREKKKLGVNQPKRPSSVGPTNSATYTKNETSKVGSSDSIEKSSKDEYENLIAHITDMGFPRPLVISAVHQFGSDDKKIVEHLCMIQTFIELGYDSVDVGAALISNNHNESQTKEYLRLLVQFRDLGFDDASIKNALSQFNNDRDKALDFLVS